MTSTGMGSDGMTPRGPEHLDASATEDPPAARAPDSPDPPGSPEPPTSAPAPDTAATDPTDLMTEHSPNDALAPDTADDLAERVERDEVTAEAAPSGTTATARDLPVVDNAEEPAETGADDETGADPVGPVGMASVTPTESTIGAPAGTPAGDPGVDGSTEGPGGTAVLETVGHETGEAESAKGDAAVGAAADDTGRGPDDGPDAAGEGPGKGAGAGVKAGRRWRRPRKERSRLARYTRRIVFGLLAFLGLLIAAFAVAYAFTPVPSPQEDATAQGPEFYYDDGKTLIAKIGVNRQKVELSEVPPHVRDAVIAAENRSFYEDPGVSVRGTIRAFWSTVSGEQLQGGSTITQQMVRNYYQGLGQERTVSRKLKEIMVSLKVGGQKDKEWILEQYLNTIFFGRDAYGIQAAAQAYYGKDVKDLTKAEAAYLAAAIQQPTPFGDPTGSHRSAAEERWRSVVTAMTQTGALSTAEAAAMTFPTPDKLKVTDVLKDQLGYMVRIAQKELRERRGYTEDQINRGGLKVTTTFDKKLMDAAKDAVEDNLPDDTGGKTLTGLVSIDPDTGRVVAFYGGRGYLEEQLSSSFGHWAQAGSGFKPIVLATALTEGKTLGSVVDGSSPQYYNGTPVRNSGGTSYGYVNLVTATQNSVNTGYVKLGQEIGLDKVTKMAEKLGIPRSQLTANGANTAPTFPLGVISVHTVQQAGVFATFAAEGVHRTPYVVKSVTELDGDRHQYTEKGKRAFSQQVARDATYAMTKVVESGTGTGAQLYDGRDVAGKTGTTDNGNALWFNGFIPQLATSVAIYRSDSPSKQVQIGGYSAFGGVLPAQIWRAYTSEAVNIKNLSAESFGPPSTYVYGGGGGGRTDRTPDSPTSPPRDTPTDPPQSPDPDPSDPGPDPGGPGDPGPSDPPPGGGPTGPPGGGGDGGGDGGGGNRERSVLPQQASTTAFGGRRD
ncbi:transglycosylase domain-containing protein [Thermomonospora umbrina]|uniref:Membrane peptidoglycan carboxypeptidase n=1 Tax=Thermomonospora umbrina TaxID=111806 RepID=A0A3D9STB0_9ACTN|nr:transglycosylase domain-containing protein [Thermomonospora umbrina]REE95804.1 membrane peptidoglycan carboxypeptidase [Thermomonospora umbrina]